MSLKNFIRYAVYAYGDIAFEDDLTDEQFVIVCEQYAEQYAAEVGE